METTAWTAKDVNMKAGKEHHNGSAGSSGDRPALDIRDHAEVQEHDTIGTPFVRDAKMSASIVNVYYGD